MVLSLGSFSDTKTMLIPYERYDWQMMKDLERCPYASFSKDPYQRLMASKWYSENDRKMELKALDRYASYLLGELKDEDRPRGFSPEWKYENWR